MARLARFTIPEVPHHVTRRGAFETPPAAAPQGEGVTGAAAYAYDGPFVTALRASSGCPL